MWAALMSRTFIGKMVFDKDDSLAMRYVRVRYYRASKIIVL